VAKLGPVGTRTLTNGNSFNPKQSPPWQMRTEQSGVMGLVDQGQHSSHLSTPHTTNTTHTHTPSLPTNTHVPADVESGPQLGLLCGVDLGDLDAV
jgi:hypothetical protein